MTRHYSLYRLGFLMTVAVILCVIVSWDLVQDCREQGSYFIWEEINEKL